MSSRLRVGIFCRNGGFELQRRLRNVARNDSFERGLTLIIDHDLAIIVEVAVVDPLRSAFQLPAEFRYNS